MSLINDALRRALQAKPPPTRPADGPPLTPAEPPPQAGWPVAAEPLLLMGVLLVAVWFLQQGLEPASQSAKPVPQPNIAAREPPASERGAAARSPEGSSFQGDAVAATAAVVEPSSAAQSVPPTDPPSGAALAPTNFGPAGLATETGPLPAPAPTNPPMKLKAIFYRPSDPWAMINSKTVRIGDRYGPARVVSITPDSVTLVCDGQTNVLTLEH